jgi:hypothetical protein
MKQRALALAKPDEEHIRLHAREIWEENGRPTGMDLEFWFQAERELREPNTSQGMPTKRHEEQG